MRMNFARWAMEQGARRVLRRYEARAARILSRQHDYRDLSAEALTERFSGLKDAAHAHRTDIERISTVFGLVREASRRTLGYAHTPQQLMAGLAMHDGHIAEMQTGEGKTLAATLTGALHALTGRGVHIASPNDYLSARDAEWMGPVYATLGLTVGLVTPDMDDDARRCAYARDITYGVASEFAFDYLRDSTRFDRSDGVQRALAFALIDEADAVLIDDATMPLSLFGPLGDRSRFYESVDTIVAGLGTSHYLIDGRHRIHLTDAGYDAIDGLFKQAGLLKENASLHELQSVSLLHHVTQALRARFTLSRDRDYVVKDDQVVIVDQITGRMTEGRRYDDNLHQALEAKEGCSIGEETRVLTSITYQSFFRKYDGLAGMTGTAAEDAEEYRDVYGAEVIAIPLNQPSRRIDTASHHRNRTDKDAAIIAQIEDAHAAGRPVLVGTPSIARSEALAAALRARGWTASLAPGHRCFAVLNAKEHRHEARIVAQAGAAGAVTIATAMAGRGTDIRLGGEDDTPSTRRAVHDAGGLLVVISEPHGLARLDRQLCGRAGRQGDPGSTVTHASWDDDLLDEPGIVAPSRTDSDLATAIAAAQRRNVIRKRNERAALMRFDDVVEAQRATVLAQRAVIRDTADIMALAKDFRDETIRDLFGHFASAPHPADIDALDASIRAILTLAIDFPSQMSSRDVERIRNDVHDEADRWMDGKRAALGPDRLSYVLRRLMLALLDHLWTEQTERLEHLRRAVADRRLGLERTRAEFRIEAFALLESLLREFRHEATAHMMRLGLSE